MMLATPAIVTPIVAANGKRAVAATPGAIAAGERNRAVSERPVTTAAVPRPKPAPTATSFTAFVNPEVSKRLLSTSAAPHLTRSSYDGPKGLQPAGFRHGVVHEMLLRSE